MLGSATLATGLAASATANYLTAARYPGYREVVTACASQNVIHSHIAGPDPQTDLVVVLPGLFSSVSTVADFCSHLSQTADTSLLMHNRAGYGASIVGSPKPFSIHEAITDLRQTIESVTQDRDVRVHLVGHSFGGYLAFKYAELSDTGTVSSLSLIDPTHPGELRSSAAQALGAEGVNTLLELGPQTLALGGGLLLDKSSIDYRKQSAYRKRIWADAMSSKVMYAGRREWRTLYPSMLDWRGTLGKIDCSLRVVAASATLSDIPEQRHLYEEYVDASPAGSFISISEANHQELMVVPKYFKQWSTSIIDENPRSPSTEPGDVAQ